MAGILEVLDRAKIQAGFPLLVDFGIVLLDDDAIDRRGYLTVEGNWDSGFGERHRARLTDSLVQVEMPNAETRILTAEQSRIYREVRAQDDDHMHVQGYAGTGKSSLIRSLLMMFGTTAARILVLAKHRRQLDALLAGTEQMGYANKKTFGRLAYDLVPQDLTDRVYRHMRQTNFSQATMPDEDLVRHLGIRASSRFSPREIVKAARGTVWSFCHSGDDEFDADHIPDWCASSFDKETRQVALHYAAELWKATLSPPSREFRPPVRDYHRVKWAAINSWQIPRHYSHVLIDECHDLSKPMLQILDCSPQAVISLGDEYQNLQGRSEQRSNTIRQRTVTHSVRSGRQIESIVNPIITVHPGKTKDAFHGNRLNKIEIEYYGKPQAPDQPAAILVNDNWGIFEWAQRLASKNIDFELLGDRKRLNMFVEDCIELYQHQTWPRHGALFRFGSWEAVAKLYQDNGGFQRIDRMLRSGYTYVNWQRTAARFVGHTVNSYSLGLIEDVRNLEFDAVMLPPEVVDRVWNAESKAFATIGSAIYVAVTRAKRRLIVSEGLRNWIEEISATEAPQRQLHEQIKM